MAKQAKETDVEVTPRIVNSIIKRVTECHSDLETARGQYMNKARRIRDTMATVYESGAAEGIPQKVMKLQVRIEQTLEKLKGLYTEMEAEQQIMARKVMKARGDKVQLALFADMPIPKVKAMTAAEKKAKAAAETKAAAVAKADAAKQKANGNGKHPGATGADIDKAETDAGNPPVTTTEAAGEDFKPLH